MDYIVQSCKKWVTAKKKKIKIRKGVKRVQISQQTCIYSGSIKNLSGLICQKKKNEGASCSEMVC